MRKVTYKQLMESRQFYADRVAGLLNEIDEIKKQHLAQVQQIHRTKANNELEMKSRLVEASAHMIESLAKMIGGPGF